MFATATRRRRTIGAQIMGVLVLLGLIGGTLYTARAQLADTVRADQRITPDQVLFGADTFTVELTLTGDNSTCDVVTAAARPLDIMLVVDHSDSMFQNGGENIDALRAAATAFVDEVNLTTDRVGIVEFDAAANVRLSFSNNEAAIDAAIAAIDEGGGTDIGTGIEIARREFSNIRPDASGVMIVLTDGITGNVENAIEKADRAKSDGLRLIMVALGDDADEVGVLLRELASQPADYYPAPEPAELSNIYREIASVITTQAIAATELLITHQYNADAFELVPDSISASGAPDGPGRVSWTLRELLDAPITYSYRLRPLAAGSAEAGRGATIAYNRCTVERQEIGLPPGLPVLVVPPTPTPTVTPTPTPSSTPTPVTPTPVPPPPPTPVPTPAPSPVERARTLFAGWLCSPVWWGWCLGILLLLFFIWWIFNVVREWQKDPEAEEPRERRNMCRWIPWLALPFLLLLLWQILTVVDVCPVREAVYFWRIQPGTGRSGIFVTDRDGLRPASAFRAVNNDNSCIGCHTVSSTAGRLAAIADTGTGPLRVYDLDGTRINVPEITGSYVALSPDGNRAALSTGAMDIVIVDIASGTVSDLPGASDPNINEAMPAWSPDGQTIAFVRGESGGTSFQFSNRADIYTVPVGGGVASPLLGASGDGMNYYPAWSPDGRWLAFTRHTTGNTTYAAPEAEIYIVPASGGVANRLRLNDSATERLVNVSNSWATWSLDGSALAFTSKRNDPAYDLFIAEINPDGTSGAAVPLPNAAVPGVFEHLPFWGVPPERDLLGALLGLWPWLIPFLLIWLAWWLCRRLHSEEVVGVAPVPDEPAPPPLLPPVELDALWQVAPTLVIGVGSTGRWVLTHVKKALLDGGFGERRDGVRFVLLDTAEREETNQLLDAQGNVMAVEFANVALERGEMLLLGRDMQDVIRRAGSDPTFADWLPVEAYRGLGAQALDLAGGTDRRPLARAGLIDQLRQSEAARADDETLQRATQLWATLHDGAQQVRDGNLVRIIVVGSLTDGMSGTLADVAHLARAAGNRVVGAGGSVYVEAYFDVPNAYRSAVHRAMPRMHINAAAAAAELNRFQVSTGLPFDMRYTTKGEAPEGEAPEFLQPANRQLFDDITLMGIDQLNVGQGQSTEAWATTYAAMADVICFRLDRSTNAGSGGEYRKTARDKAAVLQENVRQAAVGTAGSRVFRLPLVDILDIVQARWASQLIHIFLNGDSPEHRPSFNWQDAQMEMPPADWAQAFVRGGLRLEERPSGMAALGFLANSQTPQTRSLVRLIDNEPGSGNYERYLGRALAAILNGSGGDATRVRRAPRLGYALAFVNETQKLLQAALSTAQVAREGAPEGESRSFWQHWLMLLGFGQTRRGEWQQAITLIEQWLRVTQRSAESLGGVRTLLIGIQGKPGEPGLPGLYGELQARRKRIEDRRKQMDQVPVRHYLWHRVTSPDGNPNDPANWTDLTTEWYELAARDLNANLARLRWEFAPDGQVYLTIYGYEGSARIAIDDKDATSVERMANGITQLAAHVTKRWAQEVTLADGLRTQFSSRSDAPAVDVAQGLWVQAQPHLTPPGARTGAGRAGEPTANIGIPNVVQTDDELGVLAETFRRLPAKLPNGLDPLATPVIRSTDRTALTLVREQLLLPLFDLRDLREAWATYAANAGTQPVLAQNVEPPMRAHVFVAEARALELARRLESPRVVNEDFRLLHPIIVWALNKPQAAEEYALALAAGLLTVNRTLSPSVAELQLPGGERKALRATTDFNVAAVTRHPLIEGLVRYVAGLPEDDDWKSQLGALLVADNATTVAAWQAYLASYQPRPYTPPPPPELKCINDHPLRPGQKFCGTCGGPAVPPPPPVAAPPPWRPPFADEPQIMRDLGAVAALLAFRRLAPQDWDSLIMPRARKADDPAVPW